MTYRSITTALRANTVTEVQLELFKGFTSEVGDFTPVDVFERVFLVSEKPRKTQKSGFFWVSELKPRIGFQNPKNHQNYLSSEKMLLLDRWKLSTEC